jgi:hypothetical protein
MRCVKKDVNIHISTYTFTYPGNVERHNHQLLGPSVPANDLHGVPPFLAKLVSAGDPHGLVYALSSHLRLNNDSNTICNDPPQ